MALSSVSPGDPHAAAHNAERAILNTLSIESSVTGGVDNADDWQTTQNRIAWASHNVSNTPDITRHWLIEVVRQGSTSILQKATSIGSLEPQIHMRWKGSSNWTAWTRVDAGAALLAVRPINSVATTDADANAWTTTSTHIAWGSHNVLNTPNSSRSWKIEVTYQGSTSVLQVATFMGVQAEMYIRWKGSSSWTAWTRVDAGVTPALIDEASKKNSTAVTGAPLTRTLPYVLTAGGSTLTFGSTSGGLRHRFRLITPVARWRLHVRDINPRMNVPGSGTVTISGVWIGDQGSTPGMFAAAPAKVSNGGTAVNGADWVSEWVNRTIPMDIWQTLAIQWSSTTNPTANRTTAWTTSSADVVNTTVTPTTTAAPPFDMWIEAEVPADVPAVAVLSDSIGVGVGSTYGVPDSWLVQASTTKRFWPIVMGHSGDVLSQWVDTSTGKYDRFPNTARPDAVYLALGRNDIFGNTALATVQTNFQSVLENVKSRLTNVVYGVTVTPTESVTGAAEDVRRSFNTWVKSLPNGLRDSVDMVPAVSADNETLIDELDADGIHLNTAGYTAMANAVTRHPVRTYGTLNAESIPLTNTQNLNDLTLPRRYINQSSAAGTTELNYPVSGFAGHIDVYSSGNMWLQQATHYSTVTTTLATWFRTKYSTYPWSPWKKVVTDDDGRLVNTGWKRLATPPEITGDFLYSRVGGTVNVVMSNIRGLAGSFTLADTLPVGLRPKVSVTSVLAGGAILTVNYAGTITVSSIPATTTWNTTSLTYIADSLAAPASPPGTSI